MSLAPTFDGKAPKLATHHRAQRRGLAVDATCLAFCLAVAGMLLLQGGLETLLGAAAGATLGLHNAHWRNAWLESAIGGAFVGLFAGSLFAGFFHGAIADAFALFF